MSLLLLFAGATTEPPAPFIPDADRTFTVPADDRVFVVSAETRTFIVPGA